MGGVVVWGGANCFVVVGVGAVGERLARVLTLDPASKGQAGAGR